MHRGKRPTHPARRPQKSARTQNDSSSGPLKKRQRFEDDARSTKPKAPVAPKERARRLPPPPPVVAPGPVDKGKTPSRADAAEPIRLSASILPPRKFTIIAGSYEKLLYGFDGSFPSSSTSPAPISSDIPPSSDAPSSILKPVFIFPAHVSSLKAVAASPEGGKWLVTGSTDETIKVWDLRRRKEVGGLMQHTGSITHLSFPSRSHLISASEDGTLCLFHCRDWTLLRTLKGHKGRVNCVAVHPSGKLALSVGKDRTIRMWDLMRGKGSASTKLGKEGELVRWSSTGKHFAVQAQSTIDVYQTDMTRIQSIQHPSRVHDIRFCARADESHDSSNEVLLVAAEDKKISVYELRERGQPLSSEPEAVAEKTGEKKQKGKPTPAQSGDDNEDEDDDSDDSEDEDEDTSRSKYIIIAEFVGHVNRVKAIDTLRISLPGSNNTTTILASASSSGHILVHDLAHLPSPLPPRDSPTPEKEEEKGAIIAKLEPITSYDTNGTRLTCLALADGEPTMTSAIAGGKRKLNEDDGDEEQGESEGEDEDENENENEEEEEDEVEGEEE